jgi:hypothetical protein
VPKQVLPTPEQFQSFREALLERKFYEKSARELCDRYSRLRLIAPRPVEGREIGFVYFENELTVVVWTTWLVGENRARDEDSGWVIILDENGDKCYTSRQFRRTQNFLPRLLMEAKIARARVRTRPKCWECGVFMKIVHGRGMKSCYWRCARRLNHKGEAAHSLSFDHGLPQEALDYLRPKRKKHRREIKKLRKAGKKPFVAMRKRKRWKTEMI